VDGKLQMRDLLKDYADRGETMESWNLFEFARETYEAKVIPLPADPSSREGPRNERIPYHVQSGRSDRCRVLRTPGHETIVQFVGPWLPRNNDPSVYPLYCASMLSLLVPWRAMTDLTAGHKTLQDAFKQFMQGASANSLRILCNIQYYHDSSERAHMRSMEARQFSAPTGVLDAVPTESECVPNHLAAMDTAEITEEDVELARQGRWPIRELLFGSVAIDIAKNVGVFNQRDVDMARGIAAARIATDEDVALFRTWENAVQTTRRHGPVSNAMSRPESAVLQGLSSGRPADSCVMEVDIQGPGATLPTEEMNARQSRAHGIIQRHLTAHLNGSSPPQLLMMIMGEGGTGKSTVINAVTDTFKKVEAEKLLAKTATSGVAASLVKGTTVHSWAGIPIRIPGNDAWTERASKDMEKKRADNIVPVEYLIIDECSMMTKQVRTSRDASQMELTRCSSFWLRCPRLRVM